MGLHAEVPHATLAQLHSFSFLIPGYVSRITSCDLDSAQSWGKEARELRGAISVVTQSGSRQNETRRLAKSERGGQDE
jgi:hypothetical protein